MVSRKEAITVKLNQVTEDVLKVIDSYGFKQEGAYNLRLNGMAVCQPPYCYCEENRPSGHRYPNQQ